MKPVSGNRPIWIWKGRRRAAIAPTLTSPQYLPLPPFLLFPRLCASDEKIIAAPLRGGRNLYSYRAIFPLLLCAAVIWLIRRRPGDCFAAIIFYKGTTVTRRSTTTFVITSSTFHLNETYVDFQNLSRETRESMDDSSVVDWLKNTTL